MNPKLKQALNDWHAAEVRFNHFEIGILEARKGQCERARDTAKSKLLTITREVLKLKTTVVLLFVLLAPFARAVVPPFQTKTFEFVPAPPTNQIILYRIYTVALPNLPGTTNFIGTTTSNRFTITNLLAEPVRVYVSSSNVWGEGDWCVPYEMPTRPAPPTNLTPISTSLVVPLPGIIDSSTDLENYTEQWTLSAAVNGIQTLTHRHLPDEPHRFYRARPFPQAAKPPPLTP